MPVSISSTLLDFHPHRGTEALLGAASHFQGSTVKANLQFGGSLTDALAQRLMTTVQLLKNRARLPVNSASSNLRACF